jgi:hypothetical protein
MLDTMAVAASGALFNDGSWSFIDALQCNAQTGCCMRMGVTVSSIYMPAAATVESNNECPYVSGTCTVQFVGTVSAAP